MSSINTAMGEAVHLGLVGNPIGATSVAIGIFDGNGNPRTLASYERLIIDDLVANVSTGSVDVLNVAAGASSTSVASSTLIASLNTTVGLDMSDKEGLACPVGVVPSVLASSSTAVVKVAGNGRIVEGTTQGARPNWREKLTPGGNF